MIPILSVQLLIFIDAFETPIDIYTLVVAVNLSLCVIGAQVIHLCQMPPRRGLHSFAYLVNVTLVMMLMVSTYRMSTELSANSKYCPGFREAMLRTQRERMATSAGLFVLSVVLCLVDLVWQWLKPVLQTRWTPIKEPRVMGQVADHCGRLGIKRYIPPSARNERRPPFVQKIVRTVSIPAGLSLFLGSIYLLEHRIIFRFHQDMNRLGYTTSEDQWSYSQIISLITAAWTVASLTGRLLLKKLIAFFWRFRWFRIVTSKAQGQMLLTLDWTRRILDSGYLNGWSRNAYLDLEDALQRENGGGMSPG